MRRTAHALSEQLGEVVRTQPRLRSKFRQAEILASLVLAFWMIPAALDAALGSALVNLAKYASLVAAGFALRSAMRRSPVVLEAFFVGNFVWMSATVGLVYQSVETQLCLNYLADSQQRAGRGLVVAAIAVLISWAALRLRSTREMCHPSTRRHSADTAAANNWLHGIRRRNPQPGDRK